VRRRPSLRSLLERRNACGRATAGLGEKVSARRVLEKEQRELLRRAFEEFADVPFPAASGDDRVNELRADLAEYDSWVAGLISTLIGGSVPSQPVKFDADLEARLVALAEGEDARAAADAARYLDYLRGWRELVDLTQSLQAQNRTGK
jgi:hypothetical protein